MHGTSPDSLRNCPCFRVFRLNFPSDFFNLLLVKFHQAKIILVKHLIQERKNEAWVVLNHHRRRINDAPNHSATLPTALLNVNDLCRNFVNIFFTCSFIGGLLCAHHISGLLPYTLKTSIFEFYRNIVPYGKKSFMRHLRCRKSR